MVSAFVDFVLVELEQVERRVSPHFSVEVQLGTPQSGWKYCKQIEFWYFSKYNLLFKIFYINNWGSVWQW
jgi:hypothetical protein